MSRGGAPRAGSARAERVAAATAAAMVLSAAAQAYGAACYSDAPPDEVNEWGGALNAALRQWKPLDAKLRARRLRVPADYAALARSCQDDIDIAIHQRILYDRRRDT